MSRDARLVVVQGPLQALAACAAIRHADAAGGPPRRNILVVGGLFAARADDLARAAEGCAAGVLWDHVVHAPAAPRSAVAALPVQPADVAEVFCARNWQPLNRAVLDAFEEARKVTYGDGIGVVDTDLSPTAPRFDVAMLVLPQPELPGVLEGQPIELVPRRALEEAVAAAREAQPGIAAADEELAAFAEGGVLLLLGNLTEAGMTTLRGELRQARALAAGVAEPGAPIVLKPHPRASLGQAAAVARLLRAEGHPVRVMTPGRQGAYPIELFEQLVRSVRHVQPGQSSSAVSLMYLYGVRSRTELPRSLARRTMLPTAWNRALAVMHHHDATLRHLPHWDGVAPLPDAPRVSPTRLQSLATVPLRPFIWQERPAGGRDEPHVDPALEEAAMRHVPDGPAAVEDEATATRWLAAHPEVAERLRAAQAEAPGNPLARIAALVAAAASGPPGPLAVIAAVEPPTHLPGWQAALRRGGGAGAGAVATGEELEQLLEERLDVERRLPAPERSTGASRGGRAAFLCRGRVS